MRKDILLTAIGLCCTSTALADYEEVRELNIDFRGIDMLEVDAGAGSLDITGVAGATEILVTATIRIPGADEAEAREKLEEDMVLTLEKDAGTARLVGYFEGGGWSFSGSPTISLDVKVPEGLHLVVDDGSGSIEISNVRGDISVDDGSGSITMSGVGGNVDVEDGSGSLVIEGVGGDLNIDDGSGRISVRDVKGSVIIDDGSGSIDVADVTEDLVIIDDGSGGVDYSNIGGRVQLDE